MSGGALNQEREKLLSGVRVRFAGAPELDSILRLASEVFTLGAVAVLVEAMNVQTEAQVIKALIEMQHELLTWGEANALAQVQTSG